MLTGVECVVLIKDEAARCFDSYFTSLQTQKRIEPQLTRLLEEEEVSLVVPTPRAKPGRRAKSVPAANQNKHAKQAAAPKPTPVAHPVPVAHSATRSSRYAKKLEFPISYLTLFKCKRLVLFFLHLV